MPTADLIYTSTVSSNWGGANINNIETDNNTYADADAIGQIAIFELTNLPVEAATINSVQLFLEGAYIELRGANATLTTSITDGSNSVYFNENQALNENVVNYTQTIRTTSDGSTAWTVSQVNAIRIALKATDAIPNIGNGIRIDFLKLIVDYNVGVTYYDNTLNNIVINSGTIELSEGTIILD